MGWIIFASIIIGLLIYDLGLTNRYNRVITFRQSIYSTLFYLFIACAFGVFIFFEMGSEKALEYYTCFFIEKAMSLDNIFVISMIFQFFSIPLMYQHRILFFGVLGVLFFRGVIIYFGIVAITKFSWLLYLLGVILIITGVKAFYITKEKFNIRQSYIYKFLQKYCNLTDKIIGYRYFVRENGKISITPICGALIIIEAMDAVFALDSIPAIFAITHDSFIIYTSNIFAVLGLRSLFFCLANLIERFHYIRYSLAIILIFIGVKIFVVHFIAIPPYFSLLVVISIITGGIFASIMAPRNKS
ncbi:TerC/Alx family metal homeostasis membrane protein [Candidatus Tisiphia endosymbiont of Beris chalybata]|uniref:TerC/Alx family metal homeostasis membrane protein n=1 Tax=Candidatus Tisiphia endosymbiont of Beris chalybata TaxID=3066262 RepID=UPI00312CC105